MGICCPWGAGRLELEIDEELANDLIRRYHVHSMREAVHLALRTLAAGSWFGRAAGQAVPSFRPAARLDWLLRATPP
ncbi:MAG: type II toxin-antitoxin system VapB family antitoxin [Mycobacterium sp.]|nr:type II toxin-antitoxin system VapB family antitoxin [Mycobacterium sp.]